MADAEIDIALDADLAYARLCDIHNVPQWVRGVAHVEVLERDESSRPAVVRFISMPARASVSYTLRYAYHDAERRMEWQPVDRGERTLQGRAQITELGPGHCRLRYELDVWNAASIPMWARTALKEDGPEVVVRAFRRWVEKNS